VGRGTQTHSSAESYGRLAGAGDVPGLPGWGVRAVCRGEALPDILGSGFQNRIAEIVIVQNLSRLVFPVLAMDGCLDTVQQ